MFQLFYEYHAILCLVIPAFKNPVLIVGAVAVVLVLRCRFLEALGSASYYQGKNEAWLDNGRFFGNIHVTQFFGKMHFRESSVETENLIITRRTSFFKGCIILYFRGNPKLQGCSLWGCFQSHLLSGNWGLKVEIVQFTE